ncbi:hypothetical protein [Microbacterium sp. A94]|uniref:hypothetical protein n=1 Tax=Microbacterium sp. A94 TaxID=3450717 RepID=UPI003F42CADB
MSQVRSFAFRTVIGIAVIGAAFTLAGCASSDNGAVDGGETGTHVIAPVMADINEIDGTTVQVAEGNVIDLTGDDETFADWSAKLSDPAIAKFTPGGDNGDFTTNPGIEGLSVGETDVTLDNSSSGDSVTFTVEVTGPTR